MMKCSLKLTLFLLLSNYYLPCSCSPTKHSYHENRRHMVLKRNLNNEEFFHKDNFLEQSTQGTEANVVSHTHLENGLPPDVKTIWKQDVILSNNLLQDDFSQQNNVLDPGAFKSLLKDLLLRLDGANSDSNGESLSPTPLNMLFPSSRALREHEKRSTSDTTGTGGAGRRSRRRYPRHIKSLTSHHCSLHGLWLSTVAGAAIELRPEKQQGHVEIHTKIFELPDNPSRPLITSQWTGKGIISQESPTTLTIVFQEHIGGEKKNHAKERESSGSGSSTNNRNSAPSIEIQLPRTAVFVGQCLVCHGNQLLQGTWVVFPEVQTCGAATGFSTIINNESNGNQQTGSSPKDSIYLLQRY